MRHNRVAKDGYQLTARAAPRPAWFREISKEEAEWVWDLPSRRNWISGKREVGMQRRQVKERSRMAHTGRGPMRSLSLGYRLPVEAHGRKRKG